MSSHKGVVCLRSADSCLRETNELECGKRVHEVCVCASPSVCLAWALCCLSAALPRRGSQSTFLVAMCRDRPCKDLSGSAKSATSPLFSRVERVSLIMAPSENATSYCVCLDDLCREGLSDESTFRRCGMPLHPLLKRVDDVSLIWRSSTKVVLARCRAAFKHVIMQPWNMSTCSLETCCDASLNHIVIVALKDCEDCFKHAHHLPLCRTGFKSVVFIDDPDVLLRFAQALRLTRTVLNMYKHARTSPRFTNSLLRFLRCGLYKFFSDFSQVLSL